ncbi:MAG: YqiA/YcfP family alpha/beta fold hydrolase [Thiohalophilus sp.]
MIIYLHGFNSSGASAKGQYLKQQLDDITILTPSYHYDPARAIDMLQHLIEASLSLDNNIMLAGSSLGGYYAQYLAHYYRLKQVLINPTLMPLSTLDNYLGENVNFYTGERYELKERHLDTLRALDVPAPCVEPVPTLLLLDRGDEVLDYHTAADRYRACAEVRLFDGGDHAFQHLPEALPFIRKLHGRQ